MQISGFSMFVLCLCYDIKLNTPVEPTLKEVNTTPEFQEAKSMQINALFSPYIKRLYKKKK